MMTPAERAQRAWITNDPAAAALADLADATDDVETAEDRLDDIERDVKRALEQCDVERGETAEENLARVKSILSELIASF